MSKRISIGIELTNFAHMQTEGISVFEKGNQWNSPVGGWLSVQSGVWNQLPSGLYLMDSSNTRQIAICQGCNFILSTLQANGSAQYPANGGAGNWRLTSEVPA